MLDRSPEVIVLAAGEGVRLRPLTATTPKCLIKVGGRTIISRLLDQLEAAGLRHLTVVVGHLRERVAQSLVETSLEVRLVVNDCYRETGTAFSLWCALRERSGDRPVLVIEGDMLFGPGMVEAVLGYDAPVATVVDSRSNVEGSTLVVDDMGRVLSWVHASDGRRGRRKAFKSLNLTLVSGSEAMRCFDSATRQTVAADSRAPVERALDRLCRRQEVSALDLHSDRWIEIDDARDLATAELMFADSEGGL